MIEGLEHHEELHGVWHKQSRVDPVPIKQLFLEYHKGELDAKLHVLNVDGELFSLQVDTLSSVLRVNNC